MFVRHSYGIKGMFAGDLLVLDESGDIAQIIDFLEQLISGLRERGIVPMQVASRRVGILPASSRNRAAPILSQRR